MLILDYDSSGQEQPVRQHMLTLTQLLTSFYKPAWNTTEPTTSPG